MALAVPRAIPGTLLACADVRREGDFGVLAELPRGAVGIKLTHRALEFQSVTVTWEIGNNIFKHYSNMGCVTVLGTLTAGAHGIPDTTDSIRLLSFAVAF